MWYFGVTRCMVKSNSAAKVVKKYGLCNSAEIIFKIFVSLSTTNSPFGESVVYYFIALAISAAATLCRLLLSAILLSSFRALEH